MKNIVFLAAVCHGFLAAALPVRAQRAATPAPNTAHPDSPARANPRANPGPRIVAPDDGKRAPRGPLDWEHTEALSPDGRWFVTVSVDGQMRVWDVVSGKSDVALPAGAVAAVFSPDSRLLAARFDQPAGGAAGRHWQVFTTVDGKPIGQPLDVPDTEGGGAEAVVFSLDGKRLAGFVNAGAKPRVALWDAVGGKPVAIGTTSEISTGSALAFAPSGNMLAAVGSGSGIMLLAIPQMVGLGAISFEPKSFSTVVFSPDGKLLAAGGDVQRTFKGRQDGYPTASLYEVQTGPGHPVADVHLVAVLKLLPVAGTRVRQIVFADNGRALVTATDGTAQAWSAADGRLQANLPGGGFPLAVSPDGKTLAGSQYRGLACWDTSAWRLGLVIADARAGDGTGRGPLGDVPLAFLPDGSGLVTLRRDSVAAWELPAGRTVILRDATQSRGPN